MKTMTTPGQRMDTAPKRNHRARAANDSHAPSTPATPLALLEDLHEATSAAIDATGRHNRIAEAAYYRAERRGFDGGCAVTDWLEAEREVDGQPAARANAEARCGD